MELARRAAIRRRESYEVFRLREERAATVRARRRENEQGANVSFIQGHTQSQRGVDFSPTSPYLLASCGYDGRIMFHDVRRQEPEPVGSTFHSRKRFNAARFNQDGSLLVTTTKGGQMYVVDVATQACTHLDGIEVYEGLDRTALAAVDDKVFACVTRHGRGVLLVDIRVPNVVAISENIHDGAIRDFHILEQSWWSAGEPALLTASEDGTVKEVLLAGAARLTATHKFSCGVSLFSLACTHGSRQTPAHSLAQPSMIACGTADTRIATYSSESERVTFSSRLNDSPDAPPINPLWKLRFSQSNSTLYAATDDGFVRSLKCPRSKSSTWGEAVALMRHENDVEDMALSRNGDFLATASKDSSVGLIALSQMRGSSDHFQHV